MEFDWTDKVDGEDIIFAKDINDLAHTIQATISAINQFEETMKDSVFNLLYGIETYVNDDNTLVADDSGTQYLSYSGVFENGVYYKYHNFVCDKFRHTPKTETTLELIFNVASRHIAGSDCDSGGLNVGETNVLVTYIDKTTAVFGQTYCTIKDTCDKTITINGTTETYKTYEFKYKFSVDKEIESISFRMVSDNYYSDSEQTGDLCKQVNLLESAICYDDECVAVMRSDIDTNTSKNTENTNKIVDLQEKLDSKAPTDHSSTGTGYGKGTALKYGHLKLSNSVNLTSSTGDGVAATPQAVKTAYDKAVDAFELAEEKIGLNDLAYGTSPSDGYYLSEIVDIVVDLSNGVNSNGYAGMSEITLDLMDFKDEGLAPPATLTVATSNSRHNASMFVNYVCSGENDHTVIQQAINALPSTGGKVVLLEGTYDIGGTITINKPNVTIQGLGRNVILKTATSTEALHMFNISKATGLIISDVVIDYANNTSASNSAIKLYSSDSVIIERVNILNCNGNGIEWFNCNYTRFSDISFINVRQCIWDRGLNHSSIFDKWIIDTVTNGIVLISQSTNNKIADCIVRSATENGIKSDAAYTIINDNIVYGCTNGITVNGNYSTVADNNVCDSDIGISVDGKYVNVSGNTAIRADDSGNISSYSSSQYTILMGSSSANCLVIGNIISGKNYTNDGGTTNTFANNKY